MRIKKRQKPLLPSLRQRKRYLAFEIVSKSIIDDFSAVSGQITASFTSLIGEIGASKAGIMVLKERWNRKDQRGIIKVRHNYVEGLAASLVFITRICDNKVLARSLGVSGTLKKAERFTA
ncbi:ribonuclease P [Candidatus Woesearchaeota archaeon]|nr:ribonuclease P [Candidatus Woesearchaeota archaeon]